MPDTPHLYGVKVRLRPIGEADADAMFASLHDPLLQKLTGTEQTFSLQQVRDYCRRVAQARDRWDFMIESSAHPNRLLGEASLNEYDADEQSANFRIALYESGQFGQGLGGEASLLLIQFGFTQLGLKRISLDVLAFNQRARRLYTKLGFKQRVTASPRPDDGKDWVEMDLLAEDFFAQGARHSDLPLWRSVLV